MQQYFEKIDHKNIFSLTPEHLVKSFIFVIDSHFQSSISRYQDDKYQWGRWINFLFNDFKDKSRNCQPFGRKIILKALKSIKDLYLKKYNFHFSVISDEDQLKFFNGLNTHLYNRPDTIFGINHSSLIKLGKGSHGEVFAAKMKSLKTGKEKDIILKYANAHFSEGALQHEFTSSRKLIDNAKTNISKPEYDEFNQASGNLLGYQQGLENISLTKAQNIDFEGKLVSFQDQIKGKNLYDFAFDKKPGDLHCIPNFKEAIFHAASFLLGILAIHKQGYVHRDIRPSNLMMELKINSGEKEEDLIQAVKIIDLGSMDSITSPRLPWQELLEGTSYHFLPPEILKEGRRQDDNILSIINHYTPQQEMYAVGLTLIPLLFGEASRDLYSYACARYTRHKEYIRHSPYEDTDLIREFYNKPHEALQEFMRIVLSSVVNPARENIIAEASQKNSSIGTFPHVPKEVTDQLGNLIADCLMMKPSCIKESDPYQTENIGPYKDEQGKTLRRPTAEEALQVLQDLALSDWENGYYAIQKEPSKTEESHD